MRCIKQTYAHRGRMDSKSHDILLAAMRTCDEDTLYHAVKPKILAYMDSRPGTVIKKVDLKYGPRQFHGPRGGVYTKTEIRAVFVTFENGPSLWIRVRIKCVVIDTVLLGEGD